MAAVVDAIAGYAEEHKGAPAAAAEKANRLPQDAQPLGHLETRREHRYCSCLAVGPAETAAAGAAADHHRRCRG